MLLGALLLAAVTVACGAAPAPPEAIATEQAAPVVPDATSPRYPLKGRPVAPADSPETMEAFAVSLHRGVCYGRCPQYGVTIHADGRVEFRGERYVNVLGVHTKQIDPSVAAQLREPARALFSSVKDFTPQPGGCTRYATDFPSISLSFTEGGNTRVIRHYLGCENPPPALVAFEQQFEAVADVGEWVRGGAER